MEADANMNDLPIVEEVPGKNYFIDRNSKLSEAFIQFLKAPNYCIGKQNNAYRSLQSYITPNNFKAELFMYGIFDEKDNKSFGHYRMSNKNVEEQLVCFEWNMDYLK